MSTDNEFIEYVTRIANQTCTMIDESASKECLNISVNFDYAEPLLLDDNRLSVYPLVHKDIWDLYIKQRQAFWVPDEIVMINDKKEFNNCSVPLQNFIKNILGFFATADGSIINTIMDKFLQDVRTLEIHYAYQYQAMMEGIHADMYGRLIKELVDSEEEKNNLFNAVYSMPCISEKNSWGRKWAYSSASFVQRLVANAIVEGIFFSGSFCAIYWIKKMNILSGLCQSNEFIARDENMHCELAYTIYRNKIVNKLPESVVKNMVSDAVEIEKNFINNSLQCSMIGMNSELMSQYIEYVADVLLQNLGYSKMYNSKQPFDFMESFNLMIKSNFFEVRTTAYKKVTSEETFDESSDDF